MLRAFLLPYARHFRGLGWQVDAMTSEAARFPECHEAFDHVHDITWSRNPLDPRNLFVAPRQLRAVVTAEGYDIVHVHSPVAAFVTRLALRGLRRSGRPRIIYSAHGFHFHRGGSPLKNLAFVSLEKLAGRWTDHLVVMNREDQAAARRHRLVPEGRLHYMPGVGIDLDHYRPDQVSEAEVAGLRQELGLVPGDELVLMVAGMDPGKRHRDAFAALARLGRSQVKLACAGGGPLLGELQRLADELGIREQLRFLGFRRDIPVLMKASRAMLLTSEREGLPRSIMEALSMGTPVIGTRIRGVEDLLAGSCGLMCEVGDANAISAAMAWVLDHPDEATAMAARGRQRVEECDLGPILEQHETLYEEALAPSDRPEPRRIVKLVR